jgi:hypothetical protein
LNKDRIKNEVYDLYIEAQTLEITWLYLKL